MLLPFALAACQSLIKPGGVCGPGGDGCGTGSGDPFVAPTVTNDPTVRALACDLDHLEKHIEWYGSVVAKVPDVWGQARLTQYRDEFEKAMSAEIANFGYVINGSESRSDQSYLASATALSFAVQPKPPLVGSVSSSKTTPPSLVPTSEKTTVLSRNPTTGALTAAQTDLAPQSSPKPATPDTIKPLDVSDPSSLVSDTDKVIKRTDPQLFRPGFANAASGIGLEPTEFLAQKKRYLDFLNQLRRENEGDDTADSPGYSLNLLRIPVSVLPGKKTDIGYGAEITMSLNPVLGTDLLPMTFRNLLVGDIETQLSFPMTQGLDPANNEILDQYFNSDFERFVQIVTRLSDYASSGDSWGFKRLVALVDYLCLYPDSNDLRAEQAQKDRAALDRYATDEMKGYLNKLFILRPLLQLLLRQPNLPMDLGKMDLGKMDLGKMDLGKQAKEIGLVIEQLKTHPNAVRQSSSQFNYQAITLLRSKFPTQFRTPSVSFANGLDNRTAFPTSQMLDIYGPAAVFAVLYATDTALRPSIKKQKYAHLPDVQAYLRDEIRAAYEFLKANSMLWSACDDNLVAAIRSQRWDDVNKMRQAFRKTVALLTQAEPTDENDVARFDPTREPIQLSRTTALAWCLIVDAALLNDRLIRDMKETASAKGKPLPGCDHWCPYFLPDPPQECRQAFNDYVKLRWPIHVFALDPYNQEQNIADSLSTRREMQLALAIAFTNGQINAKNLTKYTRRLEGEYETISLNRTQIGFSHGENEFGWRFYPRYQTPDTPSNAEDLIRNQLIGGPNRNQLLKQRRLEPGMRECVAIVMMPSFVPYVNVDTVSNWFPITNPKHKVLDTKQAVRLSQTVQTIKVGGGGVKDACSYRDGEYERLLRRGDQLAARLPMQTIVSPVPILNTFGGFEMFSNGTSDLAPELFGWYGAPGIDPDADTTTLFLVGDHFSPLRTRVIVGNQVIDYTSAKQSLLSRQVIQVTFPKGAYTLPTTGGGEVRIHLATPYGVTRELAVPVVARTATPRPGISVANAKLTIQYAPKQGAQQQGGTGTGQQAAATTAADPTGAASNAPAKSTYVAVGVTPDTFKLKWVGLDPTAATVSDLWVKFVFTVPGATGQPASTIVVPCGEGAKATLTATPATDPLAAANGGDISIAKSELQRMAADLLLQKAVQDLATSGQLTSGLTTTEILVTATSPAPAADPTKPADPTKQAVARSILTNDQLTIGFKLGTYSQGGEFQPTPAPAATYKLAPGAAVALTYTTDVKGVPTLKVASAAAIIQGPSNNALAKVTVGIVGVASPTVDATLDANGTYTLPTADFQKVVSAWLKGAGDPFASEDDLKTKLPKVLQLQIAPADANGKPTPVAGDVSVTATAAAQPAPKATPPVFELSPPDGLKVPYCKSGAMADGKYALGLMELPATARPKLKWVPAVGKRAPMKITVEFEFAYNGCKLVVPVDLERGADEIYATAADPKKSETWKSELAYGLFLRLNPFGPFTDANNPLTAADANKKPVLQLKSISVTKADGTAYAPALPVDMSKLNLTYSCQICEPDSLVPKPEPKKEKEKEKEKGAGSTAPPPIAPPSGP
ncbi:hypothetical protein [Frigoriglobus tundricola]|uniref:hypothetical protein n=1 Tax=Frigoriglobus tundricola TaxID=2774151 RepID=UPI00148ECE0C|nr:hypothetical protein [Frigoriglobus tundricola]